MLDLAKKSLVGKAMARPDLVKQVINRVRTEGLSEAYRQSMGRLDTPVPLGYSAAGVVTGVGKNPTFQRIVKGARSIRRKNGEK